MLETSMLPNVAIAKSRLHVGVFDSGIGGVTVLRELVRQFPSARFTYLGDTANVPYGSKTPQVIRKLSCQALSQLPDRRSLDALVVACNTASSVALEDIRKYMKRTPVLGVVEPGAWAAAVALEKSQTSTVLVLATKATLASGAYRKEIARIAPKARVIDVPCPLFVPMIEEGILRGSLNRAIIDHYLRPHRQRQGVALLGCTHYPWIAKHLKKALPRMQVVDSATSVARRLREIFGVSKSNSTRSSTQIHWHFTDPAAVSPGLALPGR